jgi:hypothetical protein
MIAKRMAIVAILVIVNAIHRIMGLIAHYVFVPLGLHGLMSQVLMMWLMEHTESAQIWLAYLCLI